MMTPEMTARKHREDLERVRAFRLMDDDFMTKCFEGNTECIELVLRIVLEMPDLKVIEVHTQVFVENLLNRSIRLDILATDSRGRVINVEIQRSDRGAGRARARYNSSMMDVNLLKKGGNFDDLPETWVIFITENDVMGGNKPLYHIERTVTETGRLFGDGEHILYVNGAWRDDSPLGKLMHDFSCTSPEDMNYAVLADRVRFFKESNEGVSIMCKMIEDMRIQEREEGRREGRRKGRQEGRRKGRQEGRREQSKAVALRLLRMGKIAPDEIAMAAGLTDDEVRALAERIENE